MAGNFTSAEHRHGVHERLTRLTKSRLRRRATSVFAGFRKKVRESRTMISFQLWLAFAAAAAVVIAIPGPTTLMVTGHAMSSGTRVALASLLGVALGDFTAIACSVLGLGAVLAASAEAFTVLKLVGAAYLIYLGIKLWRAPAVPLGAMAAGQGARRSVGRAIAES